MSTIEITLPNAAVWWLLGCFGINLLMGAVANYPKAKATIRELFKKKKANY